MCHTSLFVNLDRCLVAIDTNDFTNEVLVSNSDLIESVSGNSDDSAAIIWDGFSTHQLVHGNTNHIFGDNDGAANELAWVRSWKLLRCGQFRRD